MGAGPAIARRIRSSLRINNKSFYVLEGGDGLEETFLLNLSGPSNANIIDTQGGGTIEDNE